ALPTAPHPEMLWLGDARGTFVLTAPNYDNTGHHQMQVLFSVLQRKIQKTAVSAASDARVKFCVAF
ncbi:MAG: hypothetical protein RSE64_07260, partial [Oscillospiraceae bacterium]